ncbi:hypothetical protein GJ496_006677 [Pomphorhynchus laevis]|nr:hypothetical protein GJ496_006677 [Pomphorhynchus laevis]
MCLLNTRKSGNYYKAIQICNKSMQSKIFYLDNINEMNSLEYKLEQIQTKFQVDEIKFWLDKSSTLQFVGILSDCSVLNAKVLTIERSDCNASNIIICRSY